MAVKSPRSKPGVIFSISLFVNKTCFCRLQHINTQGSPRKACVCLYISVILVKSKCSCNTKSQYLSNLKLRKSSHRHRSQPKPLSFSFITAEDLQYRYSYSMPNRPDALRKQLEGVEEGRGAFELVGDQSVGTV